MAPVVSPCDGEGLPARRTLLLEEGAPRHRVACYADACRFDELPRGGAVRLSYRDRPATGLANLRVLTDEGMAGGAECFKCGIIFSKYQKLIKNQPPMRGLFLNYCIS